MKEALTAALKELGKVPESVLGDVENNARRLSEWLVTRGKLSADDAHEILKDVSTRAREAKSEWEKRIDLFIKDRAQAFSLPRRDELAGLRQRLNRLMDRADRLEERVSRSYDS